MNAAANRIRSRVHTVINTVSSVVKPKPSAPSSLSFAESNDVVKTAFAVAATYSDPSDFQKVMELEEQAEAEHALKEAELTSLRIVSLSFERQTDLPFRESKKEKESP